MKKSLNHPVDPFTMAILTVASMTSFSVLFEPSIYQLIVLALVDSLALIPTQLVDKRLFLWFFPKSFYFFPSADLNVVKRLSEEQKNEMLEALVAFPKQRARYICSILLLKVIPPVAYIIYISYYKAPLWITLAKITALLAITNTYFYAAILIENHAHVSVLIKEFHDQFNWDKVFKQITIPYSKSDFGMHEHITMFWIWGFTMGLQWLVLRLEYDPSDSFSGWRVIFVGVVGLVLLSRIWYISHKYLRTGLEDIFHLFHTFDPKKRLVTLPLHSSPLLARFEKTFNELVERLRDYERELTHWVLTQTENSRYQAMGEIAGLIVHDLTAPLHVIGFCTEQMRDDPSKASDPKYIQYLTVSSERSMTLVATLKSYLRTEERFGNDTACNLEEAHNDAYRLVEMRYLKAQSMAVQFVFDERLRDQRVKLTKSDAIHLFNNLYANSVANLLQHRISSPAISCIAVDIQPDTLEFYIEDNGTGLDPDAFERMTAFAILPLEEQQAKNAKAKAKPALGLRLIRRLIERHGGRIWVVTPSDHSGTRFHIRLPKFS